MDLSVTLDFRSHLVALQFSFSNPAAIPSSVKQRSPEAVEDRNERKNRCSGRRFIEPTENVSLVWFLRELEASGYEVVDAFYQERLNPKGDSYGKGTYHMVRFLFARREDVELSEEFGRVKDTLRAELQEICRAAMWRVRAFCNPLYENGEEVPGYSALSINMEARKPLFLPDGQPVTVWQKDEYGERVGDAPLPLRPSFWLMVWPDINVYTSDPDDPD